MTVRFEIANLIDPARLVLQNGIGHPFTIKDTAYTAKYNLDLNVQKSNSKRRPNQIDLVGTITITPVDSDLKMFNAHLGNSTFTPVSCLNEYLKMVENGICEIDKLRNRHQSSDKTKLTGQQFDPEARLETLSRFSSFLAKALIPPVDITVIPLEVSDIRSAWPTIKLPTRSGGSLTVRRSVILDSLFGWRSRVQSEINQFRRFPDLTETWILAIESTFRQIIDDFYAPGYLEPDSNGVCAVLLSVQQEARAEIRELAWFIDCHRKLPNTDWTSLSTVRVRASGRYLGHKAKRDTFLAAREDKLNKAAEPSRAPV